MSNDDSVMTLRSSPHLDLGNYAALLEPLPESVEALGALVRGLVLYPFDAPRYDVHFTLEREAVDGHQRGARAKLQRILELDASDLRLERAPAQRLAGHCMNFAVLLGALLNYTGRPARVRSGFVTYFDAHKRYNHWITEYWRDGQRVRVDPQLEPDTTLSVNPLNLNANAFQSATEVWTACRAGHDDPLLYGWDWNDPATHGWTYLRGQVVHDIAALHGVDSFPDQDTWGLKTPLEVSEADLALLDHAAHLANRGLEGAAELGTLYSGNPALQPPFDSRLP